MESYINFQDIQIHYKSAGYGKTIVLLHGFLESLDIWKEFSTHPSSDYRVISIDLPGHGKSSDKAEIHSMELMAESVKAVLGFLKIKTCVLIGHSMGGYVTLAFAEKYPELLKGFGLFHSYAAADTEEAKINRERTIQLVENDRPGFIQLFIPDLFATMNRKRFHTAIERLKKQAGDTPKTGIIAALKGMKERPDRTHVLKATQHPVLFILGREDTRIPLDVALKQATLPQRCEIQILKKVGHMGYIEDKEYTLQTISYFAKKCFFRSPD